MNNPFYCKPLSGGGVLPLSTDGSKLRGTHFLKKVSLNGTEIPKFSKKGTLRGTDFSILVFFATLPGTREGEKRCPEQRSIPIPLFSNNLIKSYGILL